MSGGNPYAVNGYTNTNATNSNPPGRYGGLYSQQTTASNGPVNSFGPRDRRRPEDIQNPYSNDANALQPPYAQHRQYGSSEPGSRPTTGSREASSYSEPRRDRRAVGTNPNSAINGYRPFSPRQSAAASKPIEDVLGHIQSSWRDMAGDDCIPIQIALKLMDPSSLGLADKQHDFQQTHVDLQRTLKSIVNEHHQDFNSSIGTYHKIQASIQASQSRVRYLKEGLGVAQGGLLTTKPELKGLATSSQELDDTLQLLNQIEHIRAVPEKLEATISEKRYLTAVDILQDALRLVRRSELDGISAVADLRSYFAGQEGSLTDILVEELHDHLYLKSPYCQDRWKAKSANGDNQGIASMAANGTNPWDKPVYHYLAALDTKKPMAEDASKNPEADTFYYIHMIVESLTKMARLDEAILRIEQRMPMELYRVVDKTNNDVDAGHPSHLRAQTTTKPATAVFTQASDIRSIVLSEFLWTVYSKFEAIAEGHRVLHEVVSGVVAREQLPQPERYTGSFRELWKLYQMEMRSLLHDYLATDGGTSIRNNLSNVAGGDVFARNPRDKTKRMFKLSAMDMNSTEMKSEQDELDEILKTSVPGLVSKTRIKSEAASSSDRAGKDSTAAGHKLLIEPNVFNMTTLLPPSLSFLQRLRDIVPVGANIAMSTLTSFLDDFLINIFHPQLEETVAELCTRCMIDLEAFSVDPQWATFSPRPIFKGTVAFMSLIRAFAGMLNSIPQDQIFTDLIINQLVAYYEQCHGYYKQMVSRLTQSPSTPNTSTRTLKAAAAFAETGEIRDVAADIMRSTLEHVNPKDIKSHIEREVQLLLTATKSSPLSSYDIISDPRSVTHLSLLYNSMQWLSSSLAQLREVDSSVAPKARAHSRNPSQSRRWTLMANLKPHAKSTGQVIRLPLTTESVVPFDKTLASFRSLSQTALITLHVDIRCGIIHQLSRSLRGNSPSVGDRAMTPSGRESTTPQSGADAGSYTWVLPSPPASASPLVLELNSDLVSFDTNVSLHLGPKERRFVVNGLSKLVDRVLVVGANWIGVMNEYGAQRMQIDGLVMQQNLRNLTFAPSPASLNSTAPGDPHGLLALTTGQEDGTLLTSSHGYYNLFSSGADDILRWIQHEKDESTRRPNTKKTPLDVPSLSLEVILGYNYDELRTLIELCYSSRLKSGDWEESVRAKRAMGEALLRLGELMWDDAAAGGSTSKKDTAGKSANENSNGDGNGNGLLGMSKEEMFFE